MLGPWPQREHLQHDVKTSPMPFRCLSRRGLAARVALFSSQAELSTQRCSHHRCVPLREHQDTRCAVCADARHSLSRRGLGWVRRAVPLKTASTHACLQCWVPGLGRIWASWAQHGVHGCCGAATDLLACDFISRHQMRRVHSHAHEKMPILWPGKKERRERERKEEEEEGGFRQVKPRREHARRVAAGRDGVMTSYKQSWG